MTDAARKLPEPDVATLLRELRDEVRASRDELREGREEVRASREENAKLRREVERLSAIASELVKRRTRRADVPAAQPTVSPKVRSAIYAKMARSRERRGK